MPIFRLLGAKRHFIVIVSSIVVWMLAGFSPDQKPSDVKQAEQIFGTGERLYAEGKYKQAADTFAVAAALFQELNKPIEHVRSANLQAECLSNLGQCDLAGTLLQRSLEIIKRQTASNPAVLADTYYYLSRHAGGCARKFDDAIVLMQKSLAIKRDIYRKNDPSLAFDYTFLGYTYNSKGRYDSALIYLDQAMEIRSKTLEPDDIETSHTLFNLAASYEGKSDLEKALTVNLKALQIRSKKLGSSHASVANSINSIGRIYRKLGNNERALEYYRQALEIRKNTLGATHPNVAGSYYEIGNLYGNISNYHAAIEYIQQGNRILESNSQVSNDVLPTYQAFAGKMYGLTGQVENAKAHIQKGIDLAEKKLPATHPYRAIVYNIAGEYYGEIGDVDKQSAFFKKAITIYQSSYGAESEREADVLSKMASTHARLGHTKEALKLYGEALPMYTAKLGEQNPKVATVHLGIGDVQTRISNFSEAEKAYQLALQTASAATRGAKILYIPADQVENKPLALKIVRSEAQMLHRLSQTLAEPAKTQTSSLLAYHHALQLSDEMAQEYNNDATRIQLEKERREMFASAMNVLWELSTTPSRDSLILQEAFTIAEKSKAALLLENTKDQRAKTMAGVPDSLVERERDLRIELAYYKTNLYQARKNKDTAATTMFEKNTFDSERKLERFKSKLERDFPAYFKLKYVNSDVSLANLQRQLPANTMLLEYFVDDSSIYCFQISNNKAQLKKQTFDRSFKNTVAGYQKSLTDARFIVSNPETADSLYLSTARSLFSLLMIPKPSGNVTQKLIIIPDDFLAQFNFGTLLYEDTNGNNYTTFPYLNNRYIVSYAYSAAFLDKTAQASKRRNDTFAGFAPSYNQGDYNDIDSMVHPMTALAVRSGTISLPGATQEVNLISELMRGESWIDEEATETNFKKYGSEYGIIHLAMHSLLNDEEPRYSELLFNNRRDNENDGYLTIAEIYNLKLNAQLVVLSACSSGFGKIQHGDGPISLSRAFSYAGCPSVVMSLWKVPDQITTNIMKNFYENLTEGLSKDDALRAAQMKFVSVNTDPLYRHPYYWAGFVVIGDTSPLESKSYIYYYISGVLLVMAGVVFMRRRRKR
jgi:CHAT domain-containing protein